MPVKGTNQITVTSGGNLTWGPNFGGIDGDQLSSICTLDLNDIWTHNIQIMKKVFFNDESCDI